MSDCLVGIRIIDERKLSIMLNTNHRKPKNYLTWNGLNRVNHFADTDQNTASWTVTNLLMYIFQNNVGVM